MRLAWYIGILAFQVSARAYSIRQIKQTVVNFKILKHDYVNRPYSTMTSYTQGVVKLN